MRGREMETRSVLVGVALALGSAACTGARPAYAPLPSGEPVAIGYAPAMAGAMTSPSSSLSGERLERVDARSMEDVLRRFAGLSVARGGDGRIQVRIRGTHTLMGSGEPLLVLDGLPVEYDTGGLLRDLHPSDVVRVEVLKDAASTAIFGLRGSGGVIVITTRRAR